MSQRSRRPGDRVVRRRLNPTQVIAAPEAPVRPSVPSVRSHAKRYVAGFAAIVLLGTVLLALPWTTQSGEATPIVDALFIALSATAVTGLVVVDTGTHWNFFGQAVILVLIQTGGLGFMVGASLVLQTLRRGATRLRDTMMVQAGAPTLSLQEAGNLTRRIIRFTFAVEAVGAVVLTLHFWRDLPFHEALWQGIFHAISAFCNAGFDIQGEFRSLTLHQSSILINLVVMLLIQAGALSYMVLNEVWEKRRWAPLALDAKIVLVTNALLVVGGTAAFLAAEANQALADTPVWSRPMTALFQSVTARTAGFSTVDFAGLSVFTLFMWVGLMLIGGASASTAGGVKMTTVGVIVTAVLSTLRGQEEPQVFGRRIPSALVFRAMAVIVLFMLAHFATTLLLAITEDLAGTAEFGFIELMFEAMSALATVGLSTGITPSLTTEGKLVVCAAMFFGRVGPLTAFYALQRRQFRTRYRFPEAFVRIG